MVVTRTRRVINPNRRRKMTPKQIKHFGTKAQRAALKRKRTMARAPKRAPARRAKARNSHRRRRISNPATLLAIGALNPQKTRKRSKTKMAIKRRRRPTRAKAAKNPYRRRRVVNRHRRHAAAVNPRRRRRMNGRRRRNSTRIYVTRRNGRRRRNPEVLGMSGVNAGKAILSGLVGVYACKTLTPMVASAAPQIGSSGIAGAIISGIIAWGGGMLIGKWDKTASYGFMFGGLMQAGSQLLNQFVSPNPLSLSGLGDFASASFPVPQNPIRAAAMQRALMAAAPVAQSGNLSGMHAAAQFV